MPFLRAETLLHIECDEVQIIGEKPYGITLTSRCGFAIAKKREVGCYIFHSNGNNGWTPHFCEHCATEYEFHNTELRSETGRSGD